MRYLYLLLLLVLVTVEISAQTSSNSSDLLVLQKKWRANLHPSTASDSELSPFNSSNGPGIKNADQIIRESKIQNDRNKQRVREGLPPEGPTLTTTTPRSSNFNKATINSYTYQIKVRNNGTRTIKKVIWEYIFLNPNTNQEVGRHRLESKTNLKTQEKDNLVVKLFSPPTRIINARDAGKKLSNLFVEQVNIASIEYRDGSVWKANSK